MIVVRSRIRRRRRGPGRAHRAHGVAGIESLAAVPLLLFLGLAAVQFALVDQARHALRHALAEAARAGSVAHASSDAIHEGFARGLMPWLEGARDPGEIGPALARTGVHVAQARMLGWLRLERVSPTQASFDDWSEPARDADGRVIDGVREIPNDGLVHRATRTIPSGGVSGSRGGEPIGTASGQTLTDANLLRLDLRYGVRLAVPLVGRMVAATLRAWHGCGPAPARTLGTIRLDPPREGLAPAIDACAMLAGAGDGVPRLPISLVVTVRMQTPARAAVGGSTGIAQPAPVASADAPVGVAEGEGTSHAAAGIVRLARSSTPGV